MIEFELKLQVDKPVEQVFDVWADPAGKPRWQSGVEDMRVTGEGQSAVWRFTQKALGKAAPMKGRFVRFERPHRFEEETRSGPLLTRVTVELTDAGGRTQARTKVQIELGGTLGRLGETVARIPIQRQADGDQQRLRALIEGR